MYDVYLTDYFLKQLKKLLKKYRHLRGDLIKSLNNFKPDLSIPLGQNLYKLRLRSSDIAKGKSGSLRLIVFLLRLKNIVVPVVIYFKGDREVIDQKEIEYHLTRTLAEVRKSNQD